MRNLMIILLALAAALSGFSCQKGKNKLPDGTENVSEYDTVDSITAVFLVLDKLEDVELSTLNPTDYTGADRDTTRSAFAWGAVVAQAQIAAIAKNSNWFNSRLEQLQLLAEPLGQKDQAAELEQSVKPLVSAGNWDQAKQLVYQMQSGLNVNLMDKNLWGTYTLMELGSWTETVNQIGGLITKNYSTETSRALKTNAWSSLAKNLALMDSPQYAKAFEQVQDLRDLIENTGQYTLTQEQVEAMVAATSSIRAEF